MLAPPLTVDQAAELLQCAPSTVRERTIAGDLPGLKFGTDWVYPVGALYTRLDELALAESAKRREPGQPSATLHAIAGGAGGKKARRAPPKLPQLPGAPA